MCVYLMCVYIVCVKFVHVFNVQIYIGSLHLDFKNNKLDHANILNSYETYISKDTNSVDAMCYDYTTYHAFSFFLIGLPLKHRMGASLLQNSKLGQISLYSPATLES